MDPNYTPQPNAPPPIGFEMQNAGPDGQYPGVAPSPPPYTMYPSINGPTTPADTAVPIGFEGHGGGRPSDSVASGVDNEGYVDDSSGRKARLHTESGNGHSSSVMVDEVPQTSQVGEGHSSLYFVDGEREIDYILAYVSDGNADKARKRDLFQENLKSQGLELEVADRSQQSKDGKTTFVKVHAPWEVLLKYAELLHMKMPLAENDMEENIRGLWDICCSKMPNPFELDETLVKPEASYFTAVFDRDRLDHVSPQPQSSQSIVFNDTSFRFIVGDRKSFFTNGQRSRIVHWILCRTKYEDAGTGKYKFGIQRLVNSKTFMDAFPLHEGEFKSNHSLYTQGADNERHLLYEVWAKPKNFYKYQPLDLIRKYFGEKVGIYFCWLGFYTTMLIPAALVGLAVFIYGLITVWSDPTSNEICDENMFGNLTMCPSCDRRCNYWKLSSSCVYARISYLFDNEATVAFAFFMALWAVVFLEFWKRKQSELGYDWDVNDYEEEEETVRPEFENSVKKRRTNPINKTEEPYIPLGSKLLRYISALFVVIFMLAIVIAALFAIIMYRIVIVAVLYSAGDKFIQGRASLITTATAALISLVLIIILGYVYQFIATFLTHIEQHRTDTEWEDSFTLKMFLFQFVNYYGTIFYVAFFKGRFVGRPGEYDYTLSANRQEECDPAGCLIDLCIQLSIVMVGKQAFNNFKEIILPKIKVWLKSRKIIDKNKDLEQSDATRWEKDYCLANMPNYGLFEEYLEMVIQFGFVTIFVAAFPLAPFFALLNNIVEIRLDAYKFCTQWKRPFAQRAEDIGIWFGILRGVSAVAVVSNAFIIAITSDFIPKLLYKYEYSQDQSLNGYINNSLSYFNVSHFQEQSIPIRSDNVSICRYRDYREHPNDSDEYNYTRQYWNIIAARFAFVIVFENLVVFLAWLISYLIPDVPYGVKIQMLREQHLAGQAILEASRVKDTKRQTYKLD